MVEKEVVMNTTIAGVSILNGYPVLFLMAIMLVGVGILVYWMGRQMMSLLKDMLSNIETKLTDHIDDETEFKREIEKRILTLEINSRR